LAPSLFQSEPRQGQPTPSTRKIKSIVLGDCRGLHGSIVFSGLRSAFTRSPGGSVKPWAGQAERCAEGCDIVPKTR